MRDFTLEKYGQLCEALKENYQPVTVKEYLAKNPDKAAILRHDVDVSPTKALRMAKLENKIDISSTYYFRTTKRIFQPQIMKEIQDLGHEIGYHYEAVDKAKGDIDKAARIFAQELGSFRKHVEINTIAMHGNVLTCWNNTDLWKKYDYKDYGILGDATLSIENDNLPYFTDTGREWNNKHSIKDHVGLKNPYLKHLNTTDDYIKLIKTRKAEKIYLCVHPKRWNDLNITWAKEYTLQTVKNVPKGVIKWLWRSQQQ